MHLHLQHIKSKERNPYFQAIWEVVRIQVVSSRLLQVQKIRANSLK